MVELNSVESLAAWSAWVPLVEAVASAPIEPGVYMAREGAHGPVVYVGMAGERRGRGVRGRLSVYSRGKAAVSGLGEAAMDRALADPAWLRARLAEAEAGRPERAAAWARLALQRSDLHLRWAIAPHPRRRGGPREGSARRVALDRPVEPRQVSLDEFACRTGCSGSYRNTRPARH